MKKFRGTIAVDQGSRVLFEDFAQDGAMWVGEGPREVRLRQDFAQVFVDVPVVTIGLSMWDIACSTNSRLDIAAEQVTGSGFEIVFRTWADTRIARVRADWLAIGPLRDEEDWDVP